MSSALRLELAIRVANEAHSGQVDKGGTPYICHPLSVMARLGPEDITGRIVAVLHDVLEDTAVIASDLRGLGFADEVVDAVVLLTRTPGQPYHQYLDAVRANPLARRVKLADVADNSSPRRMELLPWATATKLRRKYETARQALTVSEGRASK